MLYSLMSLISASNSLLIDLISRVSSVLQDAIVDNSLGLGLFFIFLGLLLAEIISAEKNRRLEKSNFYLFCRVRKLREKDLNLLLQYQYDTLYLPRNMGQTTIEKQVVEQLRKGNRVLLTGKAGIGKTRMSIFCGKEFRHHFLAFPKRHGIESIKLPRTLFFLKHKVILFLDDLQLFPLEEKSLVWFFSCVNRQARDLKVIATCRKEELARVLEGSRRLFKRMDIPEWSPQEGKELAFGADRKESYDKSFDGTPASILTDLYRRREYYEDLVKERRHSLLILWVFKFLFVVGIHSNVTPVKGTLIRQIAERVFSYQGTWDLDIKELEKKEFIKKINGEIQCLDKYLLEVVIDGRPELLGLEESKVSLPVLLEILLEGKYAIELFLLGTRLFSGNLLDQAIDAHTAYMTLDPKDPRAYSNRGSIYTRKGEYGLAIQDYTQAIALEPKMAGLYSNRGSAYVEKGEYDMAIGDYTRAIELDQELVLAYWGRGCAYLRTGEHDLAITDYTQAIRLDPENAPAYGTRGDAHLAKDNYDLAIADYTRTIELYPKNPPAFFSRGYAYMQKSEHDLAIADYTQAIKLDPENKSVYFNRGSAYVEKSEYDLAIADYTRTIELDPDNAPAWCGRGYAHLRKSDYEPAIDDYTQAIELDPDNAPACCGRGEAYLAKAGYDLAIADYTQAIRLNPENAPAYLNRGSAYLGKNERGMALEDYSQAIKLDPDLTGIVATTGFSELKRGSLINAAFHLMKVLKYRGRIVDSLDFYRDFSAHLNSLVARIRSRKK